MIWEYSNKKNWPFWLSWYGISGPHTYNNPALFELGYSVPNEQVYLIARVETIDQEAREYCVREILRCVSRQLAHFKGVY